MKKINRNVSVGNEMLSRDISIRSGIVRTVRLTNKLTGRSLNVKSDEFEVKLDGIGTPLRNTDFVCTKVLTRKRGRLTTRADLELVDQKTGLELKLSYHLRPGKFYMHKELKVKAGKRLIKRVAVEKMRIARCPHRLGGFGQPLYLKDEFFLGLESPAGHNRMTRSGDVSLHHYPGRSGTVTGKRAVLGVCPNRVNQRIREWFLDYIEQNRARPVKGFILDYTSHVPGRCENFESWRFDETEKVFTRRGVKIDTVMMVCSTAWHYPQSIMREKPVSRQVTPLPVFRKIAREKFGAGLSFHLNTGGGRGSTDHAWLARNFDMVNPSYTCLADPRVKAELKKSLLHLVHKYDAMMFSFDWVWWKVCMDCSAGGHRGHIKGLEYGREAVIDGLIELFQALRKAKPDIVLQDIEMHHSPWWLFYAESLWSYAGENKGLRAHHVDASLAGWQKRSAFPMKDIWHPKVMPARPPVPYRKGAVSTRDMTEGALLQYLRGSQSQYFIFDPKHFSKAQERVIPEMMKWAHAREEIFLENTKYGLRTPSRFHAYAFCNFSKDNRGVIAIRNPNPWRTENVRLVLDEKIGFKQTARGHVVKVVYPYLEVLPAHYRYGDALKLKSPGATMVILEVIPVAAVSAPLVAGCRYVEEGAGIRLVGLPGERARLTLVGASGGSSIVADGTSLKKGRAVQVELSGEAREPFQLGRVKISARTGKRRAVGRKIAFDLAFPGKEKVTLNVITEIHMNEQLVEAMAGVENEQELVKAREKKGWSAADKEQARQARSGLLTAEFAKNTQGKSRTGVLLNGRRAKCSSSEYMLQDITYIGPHPSRRSKSTMRCWHKLSLVPGRVTAEVEVQWPEASLSVWLDREEKLEKYQRVSVTNRISLVDNDRGELPPDWQRLRQSQVTILDNVKLNR